MPQRRTCALNQTIITLVRHLSLELHKGDLQLVLPAKPPSPLASTWHHHLVQNDGYLAWLLILVQGGVTN